MKPRVAFVVLCAALLSPVLAGCSQSVYSSGKAVPISQERSPMAQKVRMLHSRAQGQRPARP